MKNKTAIIHLTDIHLNPLGKIPQSCKENYHNIVKGEFEALGLEIEKYKTEYENVVVCISGDIFNLKQQSYYTPKNIEYYASILESTFRNIPIFSIPGNHDLTKSSMDLFHESAYNLLVKATKGMIDVSNINYEYSDRISISGIPYYATNEIRERLSKFQLDKSKTNIMMLHSDIFKDSSEVDWYLENYITHKEVIELNPNLDAVLMGHIHKETSPYNIEHSRKTWFSKPHAFSRMTKEYLSKKQIEESYPSYTLIEIDTNGDIQSAETKRITVYPASDFIDFKELELIKERSNKFSSFIAQIQQTFGTVNDSFSLENPDELFAKISIDKEVREVLSKYLA